jgi:hypothetical protein
MMGSLDIVSYVIVVCFPSTVRMDAISRFCQTERIPAIQRQHHFGCPVYVLQRENPKWKESKKVAG